MRISDWSADVCSSDLQIVQHFAIVRLGKEIDQRLRDFRPNARRVDDRRQFLCSPDGELFLALADGGAHFLAGCKRTVHRLAEGLLADRKSTILNSSH